MLCAVNLVFMFTASMALADKNKKVETTPAAVSCPTAETHAPIIKDDWMEAEVIMGFRVWQLMFLAMAGLIVVVVLLCCFMKCRVPRTKQEIDADFKRKEITRRFRFLLDRVQIEDTSLRTAIEKVNELYSNREKMKRKKKKKMDDEEEMISVGSSCLFEDDKLTITEKIKKMFGLAEEDEDSDVDSLKETTDKSDNRIVRLNSADELPSLEIDKSKIRRDSRESLESQNQLSFMQDSPQRTQDTPSKLSLLQDSPPANKHTLLDDTPPSLRKSDTDTSSRTTNSGLNHRKKVDSQDSEMSSKKQDSLDSEKSLTKRNTDSANSKRSTQDDWENQKVLKQQSADSQDSNDSETKPRAKIKRIVELQNPKLGRRESTSAGLDVVHKWKKSANTEAQLNLKTSRSLDTNLNVDDS